MTKRFLATVAAAACFAVPAWAQTCALDDPEFTPPSNDASAPAGDIILLSVNLDQNGEFTVSSAKRSRGRADYAQEVDAMVAELAPHATPAGAASPFDIAVERDTILIYRLEPGAWAWEDDAARALFMKRGQRHNPFTIEARPGRPRTMAVRFHAPTALAGCAFDYNLGLVVRQGGQATPLVIDPRVVNKGSH